MTCRPRPIRTTLLVGGLGALGWIMGDRVLGWYWAAHPLVRFSLIWLLTAGYALLLVRWCRRPLTAVIFPLTVLGLWAWQGPTTGSALVMALATLSWVRSGICLPVRAHHALMREALFCGGGGVLVATLVSDRALSWALGIWLFFLAPAMFLVVFDTGMVPPAETQTDPFERARRRAEHLLRGR